MYTYVCSSECYRVIICYPRVRLYIASRGIRSFQLRTFISDTYAFDEFIRLILRTFARYSTLSSDVAMRVSNKTLQKESSCSLCQ